MFGFENWKRYVTGDSEFRSPPVYRLFKSDPGMGWNVSSPEELIGDVWNAYPRETRGTFHPQYWFNILRELGDGVLHETRDNLYSRSPEGGPQGEPLGTRIRIPHPADYSQKPYIPEEQREPEEQPVPSGLTPKQVRTLDFPEQPDPEGLSSRCTFRVGVRGNPLCFHTTGSVDCAERYARDLYTYWRESVQVTVIDGNGDSVTVPAYCFFLRIDKPEGVTNEL